MSYEDFDLNKLYGFLPDNPVQSFSDPYYAKLDDIARTLPELIAAKCLRLAVHNLPVLETSRFRGLREWQRAYVIFAFLTHGYIWAEPEAAELIPSAISIPYLKICTQLRIAPTTSYAALCLWNYVRVDRSLPITDPDNLDTVISFTGSKDETWFYMMSVAIEAQGGAVVLLLLEALENPSVKTAIEALQLLSAILTQMSKTIGRMGEHLDPSYFYNVIRPWIMGTKNATSRGLPNGVILQDKSGNKQYKQYLGGSNGQTTLLPFFDVVLGIKHDKLSQAFFDEMYDYMPGLHVDFLKSASKNRSLSQFVKEHETQHALQVAYNEAIHALKVLRDKHVAIVTRYILLPSRQNGNADAEASGSAGSSPLPFLKSMRADTAASVINQ